MTDVDGGYDSVSEHNLVSHLCAARAFENGICVAFCDAAEGSPYGRLTGASRVAVPFKGVVAQAPGDHEHLLITTLDIPRETSSAESLFHLKADWHAGRVFTGSKL
jgi:predicted amidohydrolase